eukprot:TRINITY_DN24521_c0_g1_i1.p1 TRINITY_DN24521_c0_g1~~TRINITY_DN24521_c0_g1_i1.p1  ORF type:complete len:343 (+),score=49.08 TRINITY_DN24521_c0_g1_i1:83-1030(+)
MDDLVWFWIVLVLYALLFLASVFLFYITVKFSSAGTSSGMRRMTSEDEIRIHLFNVQRAQSVRPEARVFKTQSYEHSRSLAWNRGLSFLYLCIISLCRVVMLSLRIAGKYDFSMSFGGSLPFYVLLAEATPAFFFLILSLSGLKMWSILDSFSLKSAEMRSYNFLRVFVAVLSFVFFVFIVILLSIVVAKGTEKTMRYTQVAVFWCLLVEYVLSSLLSLGLVARRVLWVCGLTIPDWVPEHMARRLRKATTSAVYIVFTLVVRALFITVETYIPYVGNTTWTVLAYLVLLEFVPMVACLLLVTSQHVYHIASLML